MTNRELANIEGAKQNQWAARAAAELAMKNRDWGFDRTAEMYQVQAARYARAARVLMGIDSPEDWWLPT